MYPSYTPRSIYPRHFHICTAELTPARTKKITFAPTIENTAFGPAAPWKASVKLVCSVLVSRLHNPWPLKLIYHDTKKWRSH